MGNLIRYYAYWCRCCTQPGGLSENLKLWSLVIAVLTANRQFRERRAQLLTCVFSMSCKSRCHMYVLYGCQHDVFQQFSSTSVWDLTNWIMNSSHRCYNFYPWFVWLMEKTGSKLLQWKWTSYNENEMKWNENPIISLSIHLSFIHLILSTCFFHEIPVSKNNIKRKHRKMCLVKWESQNVFLN